MLIKLMPKIRFDSINTRFEYIDAVVPQGIVASACIASAVGPFYNP